MIRLTSFATPRRPSSAARRAPGRPVAFDAHPHGLEVDCADCGRLLIATHHGLDVLRLESGTVDLTSERHDDLIGFTPHPDRYAKARWLIPNAGSCCSAHRNGACVFSMGVIGTPEGKEQFEKWDSRFSGAIDADPGISSPIMFPRFETVFRMSWDATARVALTINPKERNRTIRNTDPYQRDFDTVDLFAQPIRRWVNERDARATFRFVVVPEQLWKLCRQKSTIAKVDAVTPRAATLAWPGNGTSRKPEGGQA